MLCTDFGSNVRSLLVQEFRSAMGICELSGLGSTSEAVCLYTSL